MDEQMSLRKRVRDDFPESDSPEAKRIREDLLDLLDDPDSVPAECGDSDIRDLYSVMRSFEQELAPVGSVADLASDSGESLPELGYLLEAADDELGLPEAKESSSDHVDEAGKEEEEKRAAESIRVSLGLGGMWSLEEGVTGYDSFEFGFGEGGGGINGDNGVNVGNDYVALGGIFDYSDVNSGPFDYTDVMWGPEGHLPTL